MATPVKKTKLNRKFLTLVGGFTLFVAVVLGGIAYYQISGAPERNIRIGDECIVAAKAAEAAGDGDEAYKKFQEAISRYGRAVNKKPNNLAYNQKVLDTLALITPKTSGDAQELYQRCESFLRRRTRSAPLDGEQWMGLLVTLAERAELFQQADLWVEVSKVSTEAIERIPATSPQLPAIRAFGVLAVLKQGGVLTAAERTAGEEAARAYLKDFPADATVWSEYLRSVSQDADRLAAASRAAEAATRSTEHAKLLVQANAAIPNNILVSLAELEHLVSQRRLRNPVATPAAIAAIADPLLWKGGDRNSQEFGLARDLSSATLQEFVGAVGSIEDDAMTGRAIAILQAYIAKNPSAMLVIGSLGRAQRRLGEYEAARASFELLLAVPQPKVSMLAAFSDEIKVSAVEQIFDIDFAQWESAATPEAKSAALTRVQVDRERIVKIIQGRDGEVAVIRADARLAFAQRDYLTAVTKLEELFIRQKSIAPEYFLIAAISLLERGEPGAALLKIDRALAEHPTIGQFLLVRARIQGQLGRVADAKRTVAALLEQAPTNADALELMAMLDQVVGDGAVNLNDPVLKILGDAELTATEGNIEDAISMILSAREEWPKDIRLQRTLVQWMLFKGDSASASKLVGEFLVESPTDAALKRLQVISGSGTVVGRVTAFVDLSERSPTEKSVDLALALLNLRENLKKRLAVSPPADAAGITADIAEATEAAKVATAKALEVAPGDASLLDRLSGDALMAGDDAQHNQLIALAEKHSKDPTIALLMRGRIAAEKKDFKKAVEFFEQAQELPSANATGYRLLGFARERAGDVAGAEEAYAKSYGRRPNDLTTIQLYSALLVRNSKMERAREVLRSAMLANPQSSAVRSAYLQLESQFGSRADTLLERRRMYAIRPAEVENARQLLVLLVETPPSRDLIFNNDGSYRFQAKEWEAMGPERQAQQLDLLARTQMAEAATVYERLMKINQTDHATNRMYGAAMQRAGRGAEAIAALTRVAQNATGPMAWTTWIDVGELQLEARRPDDAVKSFDRAIELAAGDSSEAAFQVARRWSERQQPKKAILVLNAEFAKKQTIETARQLAALHTEVRDFDRAREAVAQIAKLSTDGETFSDRLLAADLANAELEETFSSITLEQAAKKVAELSQAVEQAMRLDPSSGLPFLVRAGSLQRRAQRTGDPELLKQAKADTLRAIELQANYWPSTRLLASLQSDEGDISAATQTVRQYAAQNPRFPEARTTLIGYLLAAGDYTGAVGAAKEAIAAEPKNPTWWSTLAEAHLASGLTLDAAADYEALYAITKDQNVLIKSVVLRATSVPPDFNGILAALRTSVDSTATIPFLQMVGAAAIAGYADSDRQRTQGMVQLRDMYKLVETSKGELTDPWFLSVSTLFPFDKTADLEKFVLEASSNKPDSALCRALAQRYLESGPTGFAKGREYADRALALGQDDADKFNALRILGGLEYRLGNFAGAANAFERSVALVPTDMASLNNLAYIEARDLNKAAQGAARARKALVDYPASADLMDTLGYSLTKLGEFPEAITLLRRAGRIQPSAMTFAHLAAAQLGAGRPAEAVVALKRAKAFPADTEAAAEIAGVEKLLAATPR